MTENEAIKDIQFLARRYDDLQEVNMSVSQESLDMAIQVLEEIQQYRAIGTVEELEAMKKGTLSAMELADIWCVLEDLKKYSAIGTIDEFKALKEKNEPYKPIVYEDKYYGCKCGEVLLEKWEEYPKKLMPKSWGLPYCLGCGQKLDWQ